MADPQVIIQKVKSMFFSDSSSLGAPFPGAGACLDALEEAFFCICWKAKGPQALNPRSCLEQGGVPWAAGEVSVGTATAVPWELLEQHWGVLGHFLSSL